MCQKMPPKSAILRHYSLSRQNSVTFCKDFTPYRIFFTPTLFARLYVFASLITLCYKQYWLSVCKVNTMCCAIWALSEGGWQFRKQLISCWGMSRPCLKFNPLFSGKDLIKKIYIIVHACEICSNIAQHVQIL